MSNAYSYKNLDVWEKSQSLAAEIVRILRTTRRDLASIDIMKQLLRAAGSVPANIAEGHGRFTLPAYRNHLLIARGSACEVASWLDLLMRCDYISADEEATLEAAAESVVALLTWKIRSLDRRLASGPKRLGEPEGLYLAEPAQGEEWVG